MRYGRFLRDKLVLILGMIFLCVAVILMGNAFKANTQYVVATVVLIAVVILVSIHVEYFSKHKFYKEVHNSLAAMDQKYLVTEMIKKPDFYEGQIFVDSLYEINKSMKEHINSVEFSVAEFKEYLELWIHEIKVPISALKLMNYNENMDPAKQKQQIDKINSYVEQILFYARADAAEKDYLLNKCNLETIANKVVMDQKALLIGNKIKIEKENMDVSVITDSKWLEYIISQVVNNSVKYMEKDKKSYIKFYTEKSEDVTTLCIEDNGMGIGEKDLPYVFDKTFTGANGRKDRASTGMGLYICKKLVEKLGHKISIESKEGEYTRVKLSFGNNSFLDIE